MAPARPAGIDRLRPYDAVFVDDGRGRRASGHLARGDLAEPREVRLGLTQRDYYFHIAGLAAIADAWGENSPDSRLVFLE